MCARCGWGHAIVALQWQAEWPTPNWQNPAGADLDIQAPKAKAKETFGLEYLRTNEVPVATILALPSGDTRNK
jgi:hypothetical protein